MVTIRLNSDEARIYKESAKFWNVPISTLMKEALAEKIVDELDLKTIQDYEERLKNSETKYIPFHEISKRLGL